MASVPLWVPTVTSALITVTMLAVVTVFLRYARDLTSWSGQRELAIRRLVHRYGAADSLAYFATRDDRAVAWSANRTACVSYRSVSGVALAAGDPLGPRSEWPGAIAAFVEVARGHAWIPAVVAASQAGAEAWERWGGFTALEFGDEAVLDRDGFTLRGREMRNVRQAVARAVRSGYTVTVARLGDLDPQRTELLRSCADRWRAGDVERGFSMGLGRIDPGRDADTVLVTAELDGEPQALLVLVPWGRRGLSLDLMRRSPTCESGVNELMITTLMAGLRDSDVERVSLNFAVFRDAIERAERLGAGPATRAWGRLLKTVSRWSQADSLYRFNAKFRPTWQPRYLVYATATGLPRVALAYLDAESFVRLPRLRRPRLGGGSRPATVMDEAVEARRDLR
jgi:lysyl-tRNA synthetase class 2